MLRNLSVDLRPVYVIDTNQAAHYPLILSYRYGLEKLLDAIGVPYASPRGWERPPALLTGTVYHAVKHAETSGVADDALLLVLKGISQVPRPVILREIEEAFVLARRAARRKQRMREREGVGAWGTLRTRMTWKHGQVPPFAYPLG